jgi:hypothetical protein
MIAPLNSDDIILENNKAIYELDQVGEIGGSYKGVFEFRCFLNPIQYIAADREYRDLIGKNPALSDPHADSLAYALTQLKYRVLKAPPFWNAEDGIIAGGAVPDREIISLILSAATEAEIKFRKSLIAKQEESVNKLKAIIDKRKAEAEVDAELEAMDKELEDEEEMVSSEGTQVKKKKRK